ncbi:hypothetical protein DXJ77_23630 [Vibrio parahaemolyticus]|nr:hypothetical protein DXJ77_23630 [Vibrio parahaemolyticus]
MTFTDKLNYVTDFKEENKNSRRKKSPVVATELLYVNRQLETNHHHKLWFNSSCLCVCVQ